MSNRPVRYALDSEQRFVVENYSWAKPFSSFFPGIAGRWGVPLWVYYVSKAQAICSLGVHDKDHALLEFRSFNKACQVVAREGFRTFVRLDGQAPYEPFCKTRSEGISQRLTVSAFELELCERNIPLGLQTKVLYFPLPNLPVAGLVRQVTVRNAGSANRQVDLVDGVPQLLPYGVTFEHTKVIARHVEGLMGVHLDGDMALFRLKQTAADTPEVGHIQEANYYWSGTTEGPLEGHTIVDPAVLFGQCENHDYPWRLDEFDVATLLADEQICENRTPCAFTALSRSLQPGESLTLYSILGYAPGEWALDRLRSRLGDSAFMAQKRAENRDIVERIQQTAFTASSSPAFDRYCQQTFLDNTLRGGLPVTLPGAPQKHVFYIYARQNGDLERDYHWFVLEPTYLSQGNGHYRSINQNRRLDTWFYPEVEDHNIVTFLSLIQTDGYNPLVVNGSTFVANDVAGVKAWLRSLTSNEDIWRTLLARVTRPFALGEFIMALEAQGVQTEKAYEVLLGELLAFCHQNEIGALHAGFWIDHWFYNLDLIDSFLAIYPDRLRDLLLNHAVYTFYDNPDTVQPRSAKTVLVRGQVRQYGAVVRDPEKAARIEARGEDLCRVRSHFGAGQTYSTNLLNKLLCVVANKLASLDPAGLGSEMEADKPGWCDSLNGLPGLGGSSLCEALELERACRFLLDSLCQLGLADAEPLPVCEELYTFVQGLNLALEKRLAAPQGEGTLEFWDESHTLKETFWATTRFGVRGLDRAVRVSLIRCFLHNALRLLQTSLANAPHEALFDTAGVPYTYFINRATAYALRSGSEGSGPLTGTGGYPLVEPRAFAQEPLALFLEGPVHWLRVHPEMARSLYGAVKRSGLHDRKLHMYKCCESLATQPFELGRIKAYTQGWLENESVYTHMEFKWLLEILRSGLHEAFFEELRQTLPPFLDPAAYGRSPLENSSFIVSSAFPDEGMHGQAFQPRLSGTTIEMLQMWTIMMAGEHPFYLDEEGSLRFRLQPILPAWLFGEQATTRRYWDRESGWLELTLPEDSLAFKFMGGVLVVYHNRHHKATFGPDGVHVVSYTLSYRNGTTKTVPQDSLHASVAADMRNGRICRIDAILDR